MNIHLTPELTISTHPSSDTNCWEQAVYPLSSAPLALRRGRTINVAAKKHLAGDGEKSRPPGLTFSVTAGDDDDLDSLDQVNSSCNRCSSAAHERGICERVVFNSDQMRLFNDSSLHPSSEEFVKRGIRVVQLGGHWNMTAAKFPHVESVLVVTNTRSRVCSRRHQHAFELPVPTAVRPLVPRRLVFDGRAGGRSRTVSRRRNRRPRPNCLV